MSSPVPDECTSLMCSNYGCDYCAECSHAAFDGEGMDCNGRTWRWSFNPMFGPVFLCKDGEPMARQPGEFHPVWDAFNDWHEKWKAAK